MTRHLWVGLVVGFMSSFVPIVTMRSWFGAVVALAAVAIIAGTLLVVEVNRQWDE